MDPRAPLAASQQQLLAGVPLLVLVAFFLLVLGPRMARTAEMNQRIEGMLEDRARKQAETADLEERVRTREFPT